MKLSPYHTKTRLEDDSLALYSTVTGRLHITTETVYDQLQAGNIDNIESSIINELKESKILLESEMDAMLPYHESKKFSLVIMTTSNCNLSCTYCGQRKHPGTISSKVQDDIVLFVERNLVFGQYKVMEINWFGGEPTLHMNVIRSLSNRLRSVVEKHGLAFNARIVTNGILLTAENIKILVEECKVSFFEITLDGFDSFHNSRRKNIYGRGFYKEIVQNIEHLCIYDITVSIRCNVDLTNKDGVIPLLDDLKRRGIHEKIRFYPAMIHSWGDENGNLSMSDEDFAVFETHVLKHMYNNGFDVNLNIILPYSTTKRECTAMGDRTFVIDHLGFVYKCSEEPYTGNRQAIIGHVSKTEGISNQKRFTIPATELRKCRKCAVYPVCGGGCPKRLLEHGHPECLPLKYNIHNRVKFLIKINQIANK